MVSGAATFCTSLAITWPLLAAPPTPPAVSSRSHGVGRGHLLRRRQVERRVDLEPSGGGRQRGQQRHQPQQNRLLRARLQVVQQLPRTL